MKELDGITINEMAILAKNGLQANAEVVLIYSEPVYQVETSGIVKKRHAGSLRLGMSPEHMRHWAAKLLEAADVMAANFKASLKRSAGEVSDDAERTYPEP